jgi:hypothetical protein
MGFATVTSLLLKKNIGYNILTDESPTDVCSPTSARKRFLSKCKAPC